MQATCGEGLVPWDGYIQALRDIGYRGVLAIEDETGNERHDRLDRPQLQRF